MGLMAFMLIALAPGKSTAQGQYISDQDFYDNLSPYGVWVYDPQYGDMWVPDVDGNFRPYATRGHWVLTEYGNTWVSDYPWGWATFHYGRWVFDDYYGWAWIPGYEWAPAWVSWRQNAGYYGWAPLTPNISIDISFGNNYSIPDHYWVFAPQTYINSPRIYNYYVPQTRVVNIIRNTTIINNIYTRDNRRYIAGPRIQDIERVTRSRPQIYNIREANNPGRVNVRNNTVNIFRPDVKRAPDARPARVVDGNTYKRENPNASIARRGNSGSPAYNRENASRLANVARSATPDNKVVRVNSNRPDNNNRPDNMNERIRSGRPETRANVDLRGATQPDNNRVERGRRGSDGVPNVNNGEAQPNTDRNRVNERARGGEVNRTPDVNAQQQEAQRQQREAQRQQMDMQRQQQREAQRQQQDVQQQEAQRQQREAQRQQVDMQRQQQREAQRQQQDAQQQEAQRQQREAQRQQLDVQRQQQREAQRQQQNVQQQEAQRQQREAQRQQVDMQRQQQQGAQRQAEQQQRQQQREMQREQRGGRPTMPGQ